MWVRGRPKYNALVKNQQQSDCSASIVTRMTRTGLEKLVAKLKCGQQQPWSLDFKQKLGSSEPCSIRKKQKWPSPVVLDDDCGGFWRENDENRGVKRKKSIMAPSIKRFKPLVELEPELEVVPEAVKDETADAAPPQDFVQQDEPNNKDDFMLYFNLNGRRDSAASTASASSSTWCKFNHCTNIPFSSDVGRAMAAREHHHMPEELKMRRLERTEWYINKPPLRSTPGDADYETVPSKRVHSHRFKMPKRQMHHKRWSIYQVDFLARFCKPASVVLERLDLTQLMPPPRIEEKEALPLLQAQAQTESEPALEIKELKVVIENECCSTINSKRKMRTSPRLKSTEVVRNCCC